MATVFRCSKTQPAYTLCAGTVMSTNTLTLAVETPLKQYARRKLQRVTWRSRGLAKATTRLARRLLLYRNRPPRA
jgi:hypothetical protein